MKKLILLSLIFGTFSVYAQDTPELTHYDGGYLNLSLYASSNFFGGGGGSGASGGIVSPLMNNYSTAIFSNPAELTFLAAPHVQFDYKIGVSLNNFVENSAIASATDDYLQDTTTFILTDDNPEYTKAASSEAGQLGGFSAFSFALPLTEKISAAFAFNYPLRFKMDMLLNGLETDLHTAEDVGGNETTFDMLLNTTITNKIALDMSEISFGFAYNVFNDEKGYLSLGVSVSRFETSNYIDMLTKIDGEIILNNANEYYFNNPDDLLLDKTQNETNDFYWKVKGNYADKRYGGKFGVYYNGSAQRSSHWNFSLVYDLKPNFVLSDPNAVNIGYQPKFMTGRLLGEGDEALDINLDSINLSKPHLTSETKNVFSNEITFEMPSSLTFGIDKAFDGGSSFAFNITKYFGRFYYKFDKYEVGKETSLGFKIAANMKFDDELEGWGYAAIPVRLLLFFDIDGLLFQIFRSATHYKNPYYRITAGAILGNEIMSDFGEDYNDMIKTAFSLPYPYGLSFSRQYTILDNLNVGVMIFGVPDLALKFSIGYGF